MDDRPHAAVAWRVATSPAAPSRLLQLADTRHPNHFMEALTTQSRDPFDLVQQPARSAYHISTAGSAHLIVPTIRTSPLNMFDAV